MVSYRPRRETGEDLEFVIAELKSKFLPFTYHDDAQCFIIKNPYNGSKYQYFYTTGRWSSLRKGRANFPHYWSKGINDFLEKYLKWQPPNGI